MFNFFPALHNLHDMAKQARVLSNVYIVIQTCTLNVLNISISLPRLLLNTSLYVALGSYIMNKLVQSEKQSLTVILT